MSETSQKTPQSRSTSSAADSHVKTLAPPDFKPGLKVLAPVFSIKCQESFATLDRKSGSWKTCQISLFSDFQTFSERWPNAGIMRDGDVFEHPTWEHHTAGIDGFVSPGMWPTPTKSDYKGANHSGGASASCHSLPTRVEQSKTWPTPTASDHKGSSKPGQRRGQLSEAIEPGYPGRLNPEWVEMLMGFPPGWTSLAIDGQPHQGHSKKESLPDSITDTPQTNKG
jgi:hypothetical protein